MSLENGSLIALTNPADETGQVDPGLQAVQRALDQVNAEYFLVTSVPDLVQKALAKKSSRSDVVITSLDIIGHGEPGILHVGQTERADSTKMLSSCADTYCQTSRLREMLSVPDYSLRDPRWGIRLIGCDVGGDTELFQNGTVLQFALSWFLGVPVWAPRTPIMTDDFNVPDGFLDFAKLTCVSSMHAVQIPPRPNDAQILDGLQNRLMPSPAPELFGDFEGVSFGRSDGLQPTEVDPRHIHTPHDQRSFLARFDLETPRDASKLFVKRIREGVRIRSPDGQEKIFGRLFNGNALIGRWRDKRVAFLRRTAT